MAVRTSTQSGDWHQASTWGGEAPPGIGDRAVINHAVAVVQDQTFGESLAAGTRAIEFGASGSLSIAAGVTLSVRGDWQAGNGACALAIAAGSVLEFDVPTGEAYTFKHWGAVTIEGTAEARCTVRSKAGGGTFSMPFFTSVEVSFAAEYTDFLRLGSAATDAINSGTNGSACLFSLVNCTFDACGRVYHSNEVGTSISRIDDCRLANSLHATDSVLLGTGTAKTTGVYSFCRNTLHKFLTSAALKDYTVDDNLFLGSTSLSGTHAWASADGNLWVLQEGADTSVPGSVTNSFFYYPDGTNPLGITSLPGLVADALAWDDNVFYFGGSDPTGDMMVLRGFAAETPVSIKRNLILPNGAGLSSGTLLSTLNDNPNPRLTVEHNTACVEDTDTGGILVGHGQTVVEDPSRWVSLKGNLFWSSTPGGGPKVASDLDETLVDLVPPVAISHNAGWNTSAGTGLPNAGNGYALPLSAPITTDAACDGQDPAFAHPSRTFLSWGQSLDGTLATKAEVITEMAAGTAGFTTAAWLAYIRAAYRPTNAAYETAAHDGETIGAVPFAAESEGYPDSDIYGFATWKAWIQSMPQPFVGGLAAAGFDSHNHDLIFSLSQALRYHPGDAGLLALLAEARTEFVDYVLSFDGFTSEPLILPEGMAHDYETRGDEESLGGLVSLRNAWPGLPADNGADVNATELASRGVAYAILCFVEADRTGAVSWDVNGGRLANCVTWALGHIDQWLGDPQVWIDTSVYTYIQSFFFGITATALSKYDDYLMEKTGSRDPRIVPQLARLALRIRGQMWRENPGDFIWYINADGTYYPAFDAPEIGTALLNIEVGSHLGYLYHVTGNPAFRTWGDEAWAGMVDNLIPLSGLNLKQYNEANRWAYQYIDWRDADVAAVPVDGFYSAVGPIWPRGVAGEATDEIKVMPVADSSVTVTLSDGEGWEETLTWDGTSEIQGVAYLPASAGTKTISFANDAGLDDPPDLTFTVAGAAYTRSLLIPTPGGVLMIARP